jgi:DHA1 family multidrug resistance protein-like MFS transporter
MKQRLPVILNLSLVSGLVILGFSIIAPVLPQYALSFSISVGLIGWAVSSFALARMAVDIPAGLLADRIGKKRIMAAGLIFITLSSILSGMAGNYLLFILGRVIQGIGSALYITAATTWVAQISAGEYRGRFMSLYSGIIFAATSFGPVIGGYSAVHFGLNAPFFVYGGFSVLGLLATVPLKETADYEQKARSTVRIKDVPGVFMNGAFLLVNFSVLALFFLRSGVRSTLIPLFASLNLGMSEDQIGILLTVAAVVTSVLTFPSGWLSDRVGRKWPIMSCLFLSALAVVLIPSQTSMGGLIPIMALYGFATGLQGSIAAWPADVAPADKLGTAMGVYRVIGDIGMFLGPITVSYIADYTGHFTVTFMPFLIPALLAFLAGIVIIWAKDPTASKKRQTAL